MPIAQIGFINIVQVALMDKSNFKEPGKADYAAVGRDDGIPPPTAA